MTKLYFGDTTTITTTIMILGLVVFIGYTIVNRGSVQHWGMRGLLLFAFGLVVCCFAAVMTGWTRPFSPPSMGVARLGCSRWSVSQPL